MQSQTAPPFSDLSKDELIELLKFEQAKSKVFHDLFMTISFEFRSSATVIMAYANLILYEQGAIFPELTELQTKSIETMRSAAERIPETLGFMLSTVQAFQFVQTPPTRAKVVLTELKELEAQSGLTSIDLAQISPVYADKSVIGAILDILAFDINIDRQNGVVLSVAEKGNWVEFKYPNIARRPLWLEDYLNSVSIQLSCQEPFPWPQPFCLVITLVEIYGGAMYAELGSDLTYSLSFTLPVYREES